MARACNPTVKSGARILDILELFDDRTRSVTVMDVSRALDLPQSSTSGLLSCLAERGYLRRDGSTRSFVPTARFALLGDWVQPKRFRSGAIQTMVDQLHRESGAGVVLASLSGLHLWYVQTLGERVPEPLRRSTSHSPLHSAAGKALLSRIDSDQVRGMVHRLNAESSTAPVRPSEFLAELEQVRIQGYATSTIEKHWQLTAMLLPPGENEPLALGIVDRAPVAPLAIERAVRNLRQAMATHIGLSAASFTPQQQQVA